MKKVAPRTPLGQLILERNELRQLCLEKEQKISGEWQYIRANAGKLLLSEIAALFFPRRPRQYNKQGRQEGSPAMRMVTAMAWRMLRPLLLQWMTNMGWRMFKSMFTRRRAAE